MPQKDGNYYRLLGGIDTKKNNEVVKEMREERKRSRETRTKSTLTCELSSIIIE